jgi:predicted kinase
MTVLIAVCGLPGSGKSTLASLVARELDLALFELDRLETPLFREGITGDQIGWAGYAMLTALADLNLGLGRGVVLDSVAWTNRIRTSWADLANQHAARFRAIEMTCSDPATQLSRLRARPPNVEPGQLLSQMEQSRTLYEPWNLPCLTLDSVIGVEHLSRQAIAYVRE